MDDTSPSAQAAVEEGCLLSAVITLAVCAAAALFALTLRRSR